MAYALVGIAVVSIIVILFGALSSGNTTSIESRSFVIKKCEDDSIPLAVSIIDVNGFVNVEPRTSATPKIIPGTPTPGPAIGIYEFVLEPGSNGYVTMLYDFCSSEGQIANSTNDRILNNTELRSIFDQTNSTNQGMYILNENAQASIDRLTYVPPDNSTGVQIHPSEISKVNEHSVKVTYVISANRETDKATYITANFYGICPGEILTIGNEVNEESLKWANGPFYGCAG